MKITEVTFTLAKTVNVGDMQFDKPALSITYTGEDIDFTKAWDKVHEELGLEVTRLQTNVANSQHVAPVAPKAQNDISKDWCNEHQTKMTLRESKTKVDSKGNPKTYYAHSDGKFLCFGK